MNACSESSSAAPGEDSAIQESSSSAQMQEGNNLSSSEDSAHPNEEADLPNEDIDSPNEETVLPNEESSSSKEHIVPGTEITSSSSHFQERPIQHSSSSQKQEPAYPPVHKSPYLFGADISNFQKFETQGVKIYDVDGVQKDIFTLLIDHGFNAIRLKTFVNPGAKYGFASPGCGNDTETFADKEHVIAYAKKVKEAGFTFLLDIHYSDNWADPGKQIIPERWRNVWTSDAMADSVYNYTEDLMLALQAAGATPDMVQVGNEITNGLLRDLPTEETNCWGANVKWASAAVNGEMSSAQGKSNTAKYLKAGIRAVKAVSSSTKTVLHIESIGKPSTIKWWMGEIFGNYHVEADVMGFSAYTAYNDGMPSDWKYLMQDLAKAYPNLEFLIAEYNGGAQKNHYDFDGSRLQTNMIMREVPRGLGAFFWEPADYGEWGAALFDWDGNSLRANPKAFEELAPLK